MKYRLAILLLVLKISFAFSNHHCTFNSEINEVYFKIINLDLKEARQLINSKPESRNNLAYLLLEDYIDFYQLFIYEDPMDYSVLISNKQKRLNLIKKSNLQEKWSLFLQSEILLHWSLIHLKNGENFLAYQCVRKAYDNLTTCKKKFPEFPYYKKSLGILHTLIGTIPNEFEWISELLGFSGSLIEGKKELQEFFAFCNKENPFFIPETVAAYSFIISYLDNQAQTGYEFWRKNMIKEKSSMLHRFIEIKLLLKAEKSGDALILLEAMKEEEKVRMPYFFFISGLLKLESLEAASEVDFKKYLAMFKGRSYIKECYQKLAWISLIKGSTQGYYLNIDKCLKGKALTEEDRLAEKEARLKKIPDLKLLKARLLFDGSHFKRAYHLLSNSTENYYNTENYPEFCYRMGRICQNLGNYGESISYFNDVIASDPNHKNYMSSFSLLNKAYILEKNGEKSAACQIFYEILDKKPDQFRKSLHQKAKSGIQRLSCKS
ncbi:MAG: tetratricopeptide repeat protein [Saprospiraceae bacterium]|nr:tetratricopeptide repeat protein [Saprospiraceae bacterium]